MKEYEVSVVVDCGAREIVVIDADSYEASGPWVYFANSEGEVIHQIKERCVVSIKTRPGMEEKE